MKIQNKRLRLHIFLLIGALIFSTQSYTHAANGGSGGGGSDGKRGRINLNAEKYHRVDWKAAGVLESPWEMVAFDPVIQADDSTKKERKSRNPYRKRTRTNYNIDFGMNNYLEDGKFPQDNNELYSVRPWGSWYVGFFVNFKTNVTGPLFLEWGGGIEWYTFKYENNLTRMTKTDLGVLFSEDPRTNISPIKSALKGTYLNVRFIPMIDFSRNHSWGANRLWNSNIGSGFRFGVGPYAAYRIDSWSKYTFREENKKKKNRSKSDYYLNNLRYGARLQIGFKGIDFFVNYDISELYSSDRNTPKLNAFAFGFTL